MAPWGDREEILNVPNESINRGNVNPDTLLRRIIPGSGVLLAGTGVGDETIMAASPAVIWDGLSQGQNLLTTASGYAWAISGLSSGPGDWRDDLVARLLAGSPAQTDLEFYAGDAATSDEEWRVSWYKRSDWPYYGQFVISAATNAIIYRTKEQDTGWQHQFQVYDHTPLELGYSWVDVNQPIRWDTNDFMSYSAGDNEYIFWIGDVEKHWFGDEMYALRKDAGGNVTVGIRSAGSPREFQMRDDDVGAWRSLGDFVLNTRSLTAGSGLTGGGTLAADRTFHVGAGTGIMTNLNAVYAASPALWWHANAATPAIHEIRPDTSGTTRLGYDPGQNSNNQNGDKPHPPRRGPHAAQHGGDRAFQRHGHRNDHIMPRLRGGQLHVAVFQRLLHNRPGRLKFNHHQPV